MAVEPDTVASLTEPPPVPLKFAPLTAGELRSKLLGVADESVVDVTAHLPDGTLMDLLIRRADVWDEITVGGRRRRFVRLAARPAGEFGEG